MSIPQDPSRSPSYYKNTTEQYAAIGRFVEAFERMVDEARQCSIDILTTRAAKKRRAMISIPMFHQSMTAKPVFDIFRALVLHTMNDQSFRKKHRISTKAIETFNAVLSVIATEWGALGKTRNNLLHGTWFIGYSDSDDADSERFDVLKYDVTKSGVTKIDLPKTAPELLVLAKRCADTQTWITAIHGAIPTKHGKPIEECFEFKAGKWRCIWPWQGTLPEEPALKQNRQDYPNRRRPHGRNKRTRPHRSSRG